LEDGCGVDGEAGTGWGRRRDRVRRNERQRKKGQIKPTQNDGIG
jgi:hypothetical protein